MNYKTLIENLQKKYKRTEEETIEELLSEWKGREDKLYKLLSNRYQTDSYILKLNKTIFKKQIKYLDNIKINNPIQFKGLMDYISFGNLYTNWKRGIIPKRKTIEDMKLIDYSINKTFLEIPVIKDDIIVFRGITKELDDKQFDNNNVISCTLDPNSDYYKNMDYVYKLIIRKGNKVIPLYHYYDNDYEILLSTHYSKIYCNYSRKDIDCNVFKK